MADIPVPFIGGGGDGSDECTATASDVLESKTAIYDGSGDEPAYGSMKDYSGTTSQGSSSLDSTNSRLRLRVPNTGKYDTDAYLYNTYSNIRSLIGLTADIIKKGESILGITGTWEGYVVGPGDIYYNGATGICGEGTAVLATSGIYVYFEQEYIRIQSGASVSSESGVCFETPLDTSQFSKITMTFDVISTNTQLSASYVGLAVYESIPTYASPLLGGVVNETKDFSEMTADNTYTITIDISNLTANLYVGCYLRSNSSIITIQITHIEAS